MSIDTPDIQISSDGIDPSSSTSSSSDTDSLDSISDFEINYYINWERRYRELLNLIEKTHVLYPAPPIPKCSQLHLLVTGGLIARNFSVASFVLSRRPSTVLLPRSKTILSFTITPTIPSSQYISCIFLFCAGHYGNSSSPEDTAQWSGISVGAVEKSTDRVVISLLSHHDEAIHLLDAVEKEQSKAYVEEVVCPEWRDGFLLADGSKFPFYQRPGLHGDAWFDKDGAYSIDCQVHLI